MGDWFLLPCCMGSHALSSEDLSPFLEGGCCYTRSLSGGWMLLYKELIGRVDAVIQGAYREGGCCYTRSLSGGWMLLYKELIGRVDAVIQGAYREGGCCYTRSLSGGWMLLYKELIMAEDSHQITMHNCEHWNSFKGTGQGNIGETSERRGGAHVSFSKHIYTTLNWTELNYGVHANILMLPCWWLCVATQPKWLSVCVLWINNLFPLYSIFIHQVFVIDFGFMGKEGGRVVMIFMNHHLLFPVLVLVNVLCAMNERFVANHYILLITLMSLLWKYFQ